MSSPAFNILLFEFPLSTCCLYVYNFYHFFIFQYSKGSVGLPVGVQFVSLPFEDEQVLRLMKDVESSLGQWNTPLYGNQNLIYQEIILFVS